MNRVALHFLDKRNSRERTHTHTHTHMNVLILIGTYVSKGTVLLVLRLKINTIQIKANIDSLIVILAISHGC